MAKRFWFKFEWAAWRNDPQLRRCSKETRGFWIDCIAAMEENETYFLEGTVDELCREIVCTEEEFMRSTAQLMRTNAASISQKSRNVKIVSRRILKAVNLTEYNKLKQRESRARRNVKIMSNDSSKDIDIKSFKVKEFKKKKEEKKNTKRKENADTSAGDVLEVFTNWQTVLKHPNAILDKKRLTRISARLKDGFTVEQLKLVPLGVMKSPHHMGENAQGTKYDGIETIYRDVAQVEKFIEFSKIEGSRVNTNGNNGRPKGITLGKSRETGSTIEPDECPVCRDKFCLSDHSAQSRKPADTG